MSSQKNVQTASGGEGGESETARVFAKIVAKEKKVRLILKKADSGRKPR